MRSLSARGHDHPQSLSVQFPDRLPAVESLIGSATATMPASAPSTATNIAVLPSARRVSAFASAAPVSSPILLHHRHIAERHRASADLALYALAGDGVEVRGLLARGVLRLGPLDDRLGQRVFRAALQRSSPSDSSSVSVKFPSTMVSVSFGLPMVSVPVLSTISVSTPAMRSSASASLISTPACAPRPAAVVIEIGVASPSANRGRR